jgi:hypothetical protein
MFFGLGVPASIPIGVAINLLVPCMTSRHKGQARMRGRGA